MTRKNVLNPPTDATAVGALRLNAEVCSQVDEEAYVKRLTRNAIFDALAWEKELLWQAVQMIVDHNGGAEEAEEALQAVIEVLKSTRLPTSATEGEMATRAQLTTRGPAGRRRSFTWTFDSSRNTIVFTNDNKRAHEFSLQEIERVLERLKSDFGTRWFPLANNVAKLRKKTEKNGLGTVIRKTSGGDVNHAQAASYLGPFLESLGILEWNKKETGIHWRLTSVDWKSQIREVKV